MVARSLRLGLLIALIFSMMPTLASGATNNHRRDGSYDEMLTLAIGADGEPGTIDQFWRALFSHLDGSPEYESPSRLVAYDAGHLPESDCVTSRTNAENLLNNAFYCHADGVLAWDDAWLRRMADARDLDTAPVAIIAHEWGHHIQALLGHAGTGLGAELQADCYASLYLDDVIRSGYLSYDDYGKSIFSLFALGNLLYSNSTWFNPSEHGTPSMRSLAVLTADSTSLMNTIRASDGDDWTATLGYCEDYAEFEPAEAIFVGPFAINLLPNSTLQIHDDGSVDLVHAVASTHIEFHATPNTGTAEESFATVRDAYFASDSASEIRLIEEPNFASLVGGRDGGRQKYEKVETRAEKTTTTHGYFVLDVLPGVGSLVLDVSDDGPEPEDFDGWLVIIAHLIAVSSITCSPSGLEVGACSFSQLGWLRLPELTIRVTRDGIQPDRWSDIDAGPTLITLLDEATAEHELYGEPAPDASAYMLVKLSESLHLSPAGQAAEPLDSPPDWLYSATIVGIPAMQDVTEQSHIVVDLTPGEWVVVGFPNMAPVSLPFTVSESSTTTGAAEPVPGADVVLGDQGISGLDGIVPGHQVWRVSNAGSQPHQILMYRFPDGTTPEQVEVVNEYFFAAPGTESPPDLGFNPDTDVVLMAPSIAALSGGQAVLVELFNLPPGIYAIYCYVPDRESGKAHSAEGEITVFTVGGVSSQEDRPKLD